MIYQSSTNTTQKYVFLYDQSKLMYINLGGSTEPANETELQQKKRQKERERERGKSDNGYTNT